MRIIKLQKLFLKVFCLIIMMTIFMFVSSSDAEVYYKQQSRGKAVSNSLDAWESVHKRHFSAINKTSFDDMERNHFETVNERRDPDEQGIRDNSYRDASRFGNGKHQFDVKYRYSYYTYDEPDVMSQEGSMHGIDGQYSYRPRQEDSLYSNYINTYMADIQYRMGSDLEYNARGSQAGSTMNPVKDYILELRGLVGKEYSKDNFDVMVYSGFGYRYLNDMNKPKTSTLGYLSYGREATYYYLPLGFELFSRIDKGLEYTIKGEYDWFLYGQTISHLSDMDWYGGGASEDTTSNQHKGYAIKGSVEFAKRSPNFDLVVEPFFEFWSLEDSDIVNALVLGSYENLVEPENFTVETGIKLGVQF